MSYRSKIISRLIGDRQSREDYLNAKLNQLIPSQIKALRLREDWTQFQLGNEADMKQARISAIESPGAVNFTLQTLVRLAAAFKVGLWVEFISHSELVRRENSFSQDHFHPVRLIEDQPFLHPLNSASEQLGKGMRPVVVSIDGLSTEDASANAGRSMNLESFPIANQHHVYDYAAVGGM